MALTRIANKAEKIADIARETQAQSAATACSVAKLTTAVDANRDSGNATRVELGQLKTAIESLRTDNTRQFDGLRSDVNSLRTRMDQHIDQHNMLYRNNNKWPNGAALGYDGSLANPPSPIKPKL